MLARADRGGVRQRVPVVDAVERQPGHLVACVRFKAVPYTYEGLRALWSALNVVPENADVLVSRRALFVNGESWVDPALEDDTTTYSRGCMRAHTSSA